MPYLSQDCSDLYMQQNTGKKRIIHTPAAVNAGSPGQYGGFAFCRDTISERQNQNYPLENESLL